MGLWIREFLDKLPRLASVTRLASAALVAVAGSGAGISYASTPAGLDSRANIAAYLDAALPTTTSGSMPSLLSQTGAYSNLSTRTPHAGLIPYAGNSALWTDASLKSRFIGLPYDGTAGSPKIGFTTTGAWTFPDGTVFVKNFDLVVDERVGAANPIRRLETRILVRLSTGGIRGATYKWRADNSDADIVTTFNGDNDPITITQADNTTRTQTWAYPSPSQCLICHNTDAGMVLGVKTAQQNGNYTYPATGRNDNQLHTFHHLGMFDQAIADPPSSYARMVDVLDTSATMEDRVKSYQDANCSHCHRPNGSRPFSATGPRFDMRYDTPILAPVGAGRIPIVANSGRDGLVRRNIPNSSIHERDSIVGSQQMPPLARNVPDQRILSLYDEWVNYAYDVLSVTRLTRNSVRLKFNRAVDAVTVNAPSNYAFTGGVTVSQAVQGADPSEVVLTTSTLAASTSYTVTVNRVKEAQAPQNPIWPNTQFQFTTPAATVPGMPTITIGAAGNGQITLSFTAPDSDGGSPITGYIASCTPGTNTATGGGSPLTVTGLVNGIAYSCSVTATNSAAGAGAASATVNVTPLLPLLLNGVVSRKAHGSADNFDIIINSATPISGLVDVEPRAIGSGHKLVFTFNSPITAAGNVNVLDSAGIAVGAALSLGSGNEVVVTLTGIPDRQRVTVTLTNVNGVATPFPVSIGYLLGDVNNTRTVNASDINGVKARSTQTTNNVNFKFDVDASGTISSSDISAVKARSGLVLPP